MKGAPIRRTELPLRGASKNVLLRRAWLPASPRRVVLLLHGLTEHSGRYEHVGAWLATRGFAVHAYDHRGHGRSSGPRCHVRCFEDYLDDLDRVLEAVVDQHPDLPLFVLGHSMGGLIAAAHARERQPAVSGFVLSAPALGISNVRPGTPTLARVLRFFAPRLSVGRNFDPSGLSRDPKVVDAYRSDPLVSDRLSASLAAELFRVAVRTVQGAAEIHAPLLLLHGADDPICSVEQSRAFFEDVQAKAKKLHVYPGLLHEIFNEPEREQILADALRWMEEQAP